MPNPDEVVALPENLEKVASALPRIEEVRLENAPIRAEEIFSVLQLDGVSHRFMVSKEERYEGGWVYRLYSLNELDFRYIEERLFDHIRDLMQQITFLVNSHQDISAQAKLNRMLEIWKREWISGTPHGRGNKGNLIQ